MHSYLPAKHTAASSLTRGWPTKPTQPHTYGMHAHHGVHLKMVSRGPPGHRHRAIQARHEVIWASLGESVL